MRILFIGDIVGGAGRRGLAAVLPAIVADHGPDLIIANGENSAGGAGITERTAEDIFKTGVDVITTGNHVYRQRDAYEFIDSCERLSVPPTTRRAIPAGGR